MLRPPGTSAGRRFLKKSGFALMSALIMGGLFGLILYFRMERAEWEEKGSDLGARYLVRRWLDSVELTTYDWRARELGRISQPSRDVVLVGVDDETLAMAAESRNQGIATQPWPREIMGGLVLEMIDQGAELVLVDYLFSAESPRMCTTNIGALWGIGAAEVEDDFRFREYLDRAPSKSILAFSGSAEATRLPMPQELRQLALVDQLDDREATYDALRKILATRRTAFTIPEGKRFQVWAGVESDEDARTFLAAYGVKNPEPVLRPRTNEEMRHRVNSTDLTVSLAEVQVDGLNPDDIPSMASLIHPVPALLSPNSHFGNVLNPPDPVDGYVRGVQHLYRVRETNRLVPSMPLVAAMKIAGTRALKWREGRLYIGDKFSIPMDEHGFSLLKWDSAESTSGRGSLATAVNAWTVWAQLSRRIDGLQPKPLPQLKGKVVVFTNTSTQGNDFRPSPIQEVTPGGAILGQAILNIMQSEGIVRVPAKYDALAAGLLAVIGALLALSLGSALRSATGAVLYFASLVAVAAAYVYVARYLFVAHQQWIAMAGPILAMSATFLLTTIHAIRSEREVREFIFSVLGRSVSPEVARRVARDFSLIRPERREVTVFFSDIEGFTRISEQMPPDQLIHLLEEYFAEMTRLVRETGGHLDKFIGDAVMAMWNAPNPNPRHAALACESALRMHETVKRLSPEWEKKYGHRIVARAGINTGDAVVGHVGSDLQAAYTAIGDAVNLASRLEGANKAYGTWILVGETTWERASDTFVFREVDRVRVKGKTVPSRLFELVGRKTDSADRMKLLADFEKALDAYHRRQFGEAGDLFARCASDYNDPVSAVYVSRCRLYAATPPPAEWDGVFELKEK